MTRSVFFRLLPLLILYFLVFAFLADNSLSYGDEWRYAMYAENLTKGFYAPRDSLYLWNGPGYPLLLVPFAFFDIPWIYAKMLNPLLIFIAVCLFFTAIRSFTTEKPALFSAYLFGLYPPFFGEFRYLLTEPFALMLVTLFSLLILRLFQTGKHRFIFLSALACALLALTKVFYGYVATALLIFSLVASIWSRLWRKVVPVYVLALLFCVPYLIYTYALTGKVFCWGNSGGQVLYWLTSNDPNDLGSWFGEEWVASRPELAYHRPFFQQFKGLNEVQKDTLLKKKALQNIKENPRKVLLNYISNLGRLFLNFPFSYKYQHPRTLVYLVPNSLLLGAIVFSLYPLVKFRKHLPPAIVHACGISAVYIAGHSLVYAEARYFCAVLPFVFLVVAFTATNLVTVRARENPHEILNT